ncbi:MAG: Rieske (2Fe-2S) protein [Planctomycetota bacterium]
MPDWTDIADADELPAGGRLCTTVEGKGLVVLNVDGTPYAIANQCPHAGRPMEDGEVQGLVITCPFHGYAYNLKNGNNLDHPEFEPPIPTYPVRIEGGKVQVKPDAVNDAAE